MTTTPRTPDVLPPAAYLRCPLGAAAALQNQRNALRRFAARLGVPAPVFYEDYLVPGADPDRSRPRFEALTHAVLDGSHRLLLLPGPWTLAGTESRVHAALRLLTAAGCSRILMLPAPIRPVRVGPGRNGAGPSGAPVRPGFLP
ncbi:recombinase family protein [Streptomyces sp. NPDC058548]|uniref:recombinase family protein n=1 Tax=Streptomyces sp. NPDC058548 TaxID=3346545 RepID=UPI0036523858